MLKQKIQEQQISALKAGEKTKLDTYRYILAQIQNVEIEKKRDLTDEEVLVVLKKAVKELKESIEAFEKGKRTDLADEYKKQLEIVLPFLPKELSDEELMTEIDKIVNENQEIYKKNPKAIIGICIKQLKAKADPAKIMQLLSQKYEVR